MELDSRKIQKYNQAYQRWLNSVPQDSYAHDNSLCCCFAHLLSNEAQKEGFATYKVCALASERGDGKKGVSTFLPQESGGFAKVSWDYHMAFAIEAPVYKDSPKTEFLVADPVLFGDKLVTLKQWKQALACPDYAFAMAKKGTQLQHSPTGFWLNELEPRDQDTYSKNQIGKLQEEAQAGNLKKYKPLKSMLVPVVNNIKPHTAALNFKRV